MPISPAPRSFFDAPRYMTPDDLFDFERDSWRALPYDMPLSPVVPSTVHQIGAPVNEVSKGFKALMDSLRTVAEPFSPEEDDTERAIQRAEFAARLANALAEQSDRDRAVRSDLLSRGVPVDVADQEDAFDYDPYSSAAFDSRMGEALAPDLTSAAKAKAALDAIAIAKALAEQSPHDRALRSDLLSRGIMVDVADQEDAFDRMPEVGALVAAYSPAVLSALDEAYGEEAVQEAAREAARARAFSNIAPDVESEQEPASRVADFANPALMSQELGFDPAEAAREAARATALAALAQEAEQAQQEQESTAFESTPETSRVGAFANAFVSPFADPVKTELALLEREMAALAPMRDEARRVVEEVNQMLALENAAVMPAQVQQSLDDAERMAQYQESIMTAANMAPVTGLNPARLSDNPVVSLGLAPVSFGIVSSYPTVDLASIGFNDARNVEFGDQAIENSFSQEPAAAVANALASLNAQDAAFGEDAFSNATPAFGFDAGVVTTDPAAIASNLGLDTLGFDSGAFDSQMGNALDPTPGLGTKSSTEAESETESDKAPAPDVAPAPDTAPSPSSTSTDSSDPAAGMGPGAGTGPGEGGPGSGSGGGGDSTGPGAGVGPGDGAASGSGGGGGNSTGPGAGVGPGDAGGLFARGGRIKRRKAMTKAKPRGLGALAMRRYAY